MKMPTGFWLEQPGEKVAIGCMWSKKKAMTYIWFTKDKKVVSIRRKGLMLVHQRQALRIQMESPEEDVRVIGQRRNSRYRNQ